MADVDPDALDRLVSVAKAREALGTDAPAGSFVKDGLADHPSVYGNRNDRLNIDFSVVRLGFPELQTMDPRVVRIAPGANNERHRHAHESLFVVLEGEGEVLVGETWNPLHQGQIAFVPRWIFHQTRNVSDTHELVLLAITDFGFTSAVLGDYDRRTRLAADGVDAPPDRPAGSPPRPERAEPEPVPVAARRPVDRTPVSVERTPSRPPPRANPDPPYPIGWWRYIVGGGPKREP
ncbi:MAG: cupin domain-containing protein [Myxococcota bacterium]